MVIVITQNSEYNYRVKHIHSKDFVVDINMKKIANVIANTYKIFGVAKNIDLSKEIRLCPVTIAISKML
jgi:hypothetical protein